MRQPSSTDVVEVLHGAGIYALTPREVARILRISEPAVYRAAKSKAGLVACRWGGSMRFLVKDVFTGGEQFQRLIDMSNLKKQNSKKN